MTGSFAVQTSALVRSVRRGAIRSPPRGGRKASVMPENSESERSVLTAAQGADRVAERRKRVRRKEETSDDSPTYTCEACGGHGFEVNVAFVRTREFTQALRCGCSTAPNGIAARVTFRVTTSHERNGGVLGDDHRVGWGDESGEEEVDREVEELERETCCAACLEGALPSDWDSEEDGIDDDVEVSDEDQFVVCADCGHEIEFGYSHPEDGGRIWPCEARDFNPWMTFPAPRYREAWAARGWLRPEGRR